MPSLFSLDVRIDLRVRAFQIGVGHQARSAVAWTDDVDHVQVALADEPVPMDIKKIQSGRCAPVAQQARLHVIQRQRAVEQRIVLEINLADRKIVGRTPVGVHAVKLLATQRAFGGLRRKFHCGGFAHDVPRMGKLRDVQPNASEEMIAESCRSCGQPPKGDSSLNHNFIVSS